MDVPQIMEFLRRLGCEKIYVGSGKWVKATCPLQYRHNDGCDSTPSFAVSIDPGDMSNCRCMACGAHGDLMTILWRLEADGRRSRPDLARFLMQHNQINAEKFEFNGKEPTDLHGKIQAAKRRKYVPRPPQNYVRPDDEPQAEVPENVLRQMIDAMPEHVMEHLTQKPNSLLGREGRGLTPMTVAEWELGWHASQRRICIPIRDEDGKLVALSGRAFNGAKPKYLHSRFKRDRVLYGEHKRNKLVRSGYLFEGFFQAIFSWQCGYENVLARMGTHLSHLQAAKLVRWFDHLTIVPDGDKAGKDAAERDRRTLEHMQITDDNGEVHRLEQIAISDMPKGKDADTLEPSRLRALLGPRNTA